MIVLKVKAALNMPIPRTWATQEKDQVVRDEDE